MLLLPLVMVGVFAGIARAELQSHRAVYTFKLASASAGSDIVNITGAMRLAMEQTCDGWVMAQDIDMDLSTAIGDVIRNQLRFAAWESASGLEYDFVVRNRVGDVPDNIRGHASIPSRTEEGAADFREPEAQSFSLPAETLFPVQHLIRILAAAKAGTNQVSHMAFDGTYVQGPLRAVTFIGGRLMPDATKVKTFGTLLDSVGWNIRLAYFDPEQKDGTPTVEIEIYQLENGVSPKLLLDYGTFSTTVELVSIESIKPPVCS